MYFFYFNDCLPRFFDTHLLVNCLENTLREYKNVKESYPDDIDGILTDYEPFNMILSDPAVSLGSCINCLNREYKRYAYSVFNKYPTSNFTTTDEVDEIIEENFVITLCDEHISAISIYRAKINDGILFTLPVHDNLALSQLEIHGDTKKIEIDNLYGSIENTAYIKQIIFEDKQSKCGNFEKLVGIIGYNCYSERFKREFDSLTKTVQDSIIVHFQKAKERAGQTDFFADEFLIKDVTPVKELMVRVFELRIFNPVGYRVYFHETNEVVYLASIRKKPPKKSQDTDIRASIDIIKELIIRGQGVFLSH